MANAHDASSSSNADGRAAALAACEVGSSNAKQALAGLARRMRLAGARADICTARQALSGLALRVRTARVRALMLHLATAHTAIEDGSASTSEETEVST